MFFIKLFLIVENFLQWIRALRQYSYQSSLLDREAEHLAPGACGTLSESRGEQPGTPVAGFLDRHDARGRQSPHGGLYPPGGQIPGTKYENFLHDLTETGQGQFLSYLPVLRELGYPVWDISPAALHLLLSAYPTALFEPVIHSYPPDDAIRCLDTVEAFFLPGWKKLMGF